METTQGIRRAGAIIIAAALSLPALIAAHAGTNEGRAVTVSATRARRRQRTAGSGSTCGTTARTCS